MRVDKILSYEMRDDLENFILRLESMNVREEVRIIALMQFNESN